MTTYPLEPGPERMQELGQAALDWVTRFVEGLAGAPSDGRNTASQSPDPALREALLAEPREDPSEFGVLLALFGAAAAQAIETAGPAYLGYVPGGGLYVSALAEFLARSANRFTGLAATAPELAAMEHGVLRWLCRTFRLPETAGGLITTGGSMATLSAIVAARQDRLGEDFSAGTLYLSARTHHSAAKAARIAGLPAAAVRVVPTTVDLRMDVAAASQMIAADRQAGRRPFLLVANAGSTDTGTIDPLGDLGRLAAREGLWFHVDGAYGGFFQLTRRGRAALSGVAAADSIVLDPHKGLFLPYGTGVLLVRDTAPLRAAHWRRRRRRQRRRRQLPPGSQQRSRTARLQRARPGTEPGLPRPAGVASAAAARRRRVPRRARRETRPRRARPCRSGPGPPAGAALAAGPVHGGLPPAPR